MANFSIFMPYRPEPGYCIPIETDLVRAVRRLTEDDHFITWLNGGAWVLSYRVGDGKQVDAAFLGSAALPQASRGTVESMVSFVKALKSQREEYAGAQRQMDQDEKRRLQKLTDEQAEEQDYRDFLRRKAGEHWNDHPVLGGRR